MRSDYKKFADEGFLRTIDAALLHRFMATHAIALRHLDVDVLLSDPEAGREAVRTFLLGPRDQCPESLTAALHRVAKFDRSIGLDILQEEARRRGVILVEPAEIASATPRNVALRTFIEHQDLFIAAENSLDFIQPTRVAEFITPEEGVATELGSDQIAALEELARITFKADMRGDFCEVLTHDDEDEVHVSFRHGAHLDTREVVGGSGRSVTSFREIDKVVLAYSSLRGRLKVWGGSKAHRTALTDGFAEIALGRPGFFKATNAQKLYTLEPAEQAGGDFRFRHAHDEGIESVRIYEAQVNRTAINARSGSERTQYSIIVRDIAGEALRRLHESRSDIVYGQGWKLDHLTLKIILKTDGPRPVALTVKIKPDDTLSFQRHHHEERVMKLLRLNGMLHARATAPAALAAE